MFPITGCCLLVEDVERSRAFYTERVGFELIRQAEGFAQYRPTAGVHVSTWEVAHFCRETGLPLGAPRALHKAMAALRLASPADVDRAHEILCARGVVFPQPPRLYPWKAYAAYFADPDGNLWEIFCWTEGGPVVEGGPPPSEALSRVPVAALCLLPHRLDDLLPFYVERLGFAVRRQEESFVQFQSRLGLALCLWEIGHVVRHIGFEPWSPGDRSRKVACTVRLGSRGEIDNLHRLLSSRGVAIPRAPTAYPWNTYGFYFEDPDGNSWEIYHWLEGGPKGDVYQLTDPATMERIVRSGSVAR